MFSRIPEAFALLRKHMQAFIESDGEKLVSDEKLKNEVLVVKLIELRERLIEIWTRAMGKDPNIDLSIKFAFEKIVN